MLNPINALRLLSPYYDRVDLAADYYDRRIFDGATYADLDARGRHPFLILNATDMALGSRFEFTQDQFDLLGRTCRRSPWRAPSRPPRPFPSS